MASVTSTQTAHIAGFGMTAGADGYLFRPTSEEQIFDVFRLAKSMGRQVVLRGAGRSYGDASIASEALILDCSRMDQVLSWDPSTGEIVCGPGVTIEKLWRSCIEDGYWPPVVSGTMFPTLAGALAMNIHGKNNFREGTLGEHVLELRVVCPSGDVLELTPSDPRFSIVVSGAGLIGAVTRVKLKMKKVPSGNLNVLPVSIRDWNHHFEVFEKHESTADYMVGWVDCLSSNGRGEFHAAWYADGPPATFRQENQDLPDTILGFFPKSVMWRLLKPLNNSVGMKLINAGKYYARRFKGDQKLHGQSLVGFSFLLDYVPGWRNTYLPGGFIQYQSFVPREAAPKVFTRQIELQHQSMVPAFLGVLKRHRPDAFNFSHAVDGYSLALDIKVSPGMWPKVQELCHRMNDLVLGAGGRFYLAKDSTLRPEDFAQAVGTEALDRYFKLKATTDPDNLLTSSMAKRLHLEGR
ncbi:MAG: FAD-binding oxidoreductase [Armatimonadota bacterium]